MVVYMEIFLPVSMHINLSLDQRLRIEYLTTNHRDGDFNRSDG